MTTAAIRTRGVVNALTKRGPLRASSPVLGHVCPGCDQPFVVGDYVTFVPLGPGGDVLSRLRAREGRWYAATAAVLHYICATGKTGRAGRPPKLRKT